MEKSIIYYTDCRLDESIASVVRGQIARSGLPIVSVSLNRPVKFGSNTVLHREPSAFTMIDQIEFALRLSTSKYVFFCEHDVLYPVSHFDFTPPEDDVFYYDDHVWRWDYPKDRLIGYERLISLSGLCVNRAFALSHYQRRIVKIMQEGWYKDTSRDPAWARIMGFEPGTKSVKRGGFSDDRYEIWHGKEPMIDIRHDKTYSKRKVGLDEFKHPPTNWKETTIDATGWKLKEMFHL